MSAALLKEAAECYTDVTEERRWSLTGAWLHSRDKLSEGSTVTTNYYFLLSAEVADL